MTVERYMVTIPHRPNYYALITLCEVPNTPECHTTSGKNLWRATVLTRSGWDVAYQEDRDAAIMEALKFPGMRAFTRREAEAKDPLAVAIPSPSSKTTGLYLRVSTADLDTLRAHVNSLNEQARAIGGPPIGLTTWIRDLALRHAKSKA